MSRYFIEVAYKGTLYAGFQSQENANTIQAEVEKALAIFFRKDLLLTGASRTDAGVHAFQNYFHVDVEFDNVPAWEKVAYHLNAILPPGIVVKKIFEVPGQAHSRFDAMYRMYEYRIYQQKDPFLNDRAYYYPYKLNMDALQQAAGMLLGKADFETFSKKNTQVNNFNCNILESEWTEQSGSFKYKVKGNRFLRGMVRGLVGTMLKVGRGVTSIEQFQQVIDARDPSKADFAVPPQGLTLIEVAYPPAITQGMILGSVGKE